MNATADWMLAADSANCNNWHAVALTAIGLNIDSTLQSKHLKGTSACTFIIYATIICSY